jgi:hypothetical protein
MRQAVLTAASLVEEDTPVALGHHAERDAYNQRATPADISRGCGVFRY